MNKPTFEDSWPQLEKDLRAALCRRRIPVDEREDILQETALRLLRNWDRIRPESLWAFALTIALNIVRDEARKASRHERVGPENNLVENDPERQALLRLELDRVRIALTSLTERQRTILLGEVGEATIEASSPAQKMARMRARRRLRSLIEDVSALVTVPLARARRSILGSDTGLAHTAASLAMGLATVTSAAVIAMPAGTGDRVGSRSDTRFGATAATAARAVDGGSPAARSSTAWTSPVSPALKGSVSAVADAGDDLNRHFGVVHKEGDSFTVGGEEQVGPYGIEQKISQGVGGSDLEAEVDARYDAARCMNEFLRRPHSPCGNTGRLRARARAAVNGVGYERELDSLVSH